MKWGGELNDKMLLSRWVMMLKVIITAKGTWWDNWSYFQKRVKPGKAFGFGHFLLFSFSFFSSQRYILMIRESMCLGIEVVDALTISFQASAPRLGTFTWSVRMQLQLFCLIIDVPHLFPPASISYLVLWILSLKHFFSFHSLFFMTIPSPHSNNEAAFWASHTDFENSTLTDF